MSHLQLIRSENASFHEYYVRGCAPAQEIEQVFQQISKMCVTHDATMIYLRFFVKETVFRTVQSCWRRFPEAARGPVTWIVQPEKAGIPDLSLQGYAVNAPDVQPIYDRGKISGFRFGDHHASCLHLNVHSRPSDQPADSAFSVFEGMQRQLRLAGSDFSHTVRTWLFADRILSWYGQLNQERDRFFQQHGIFDKLVPASTGIGAANPLGAALTAELLAIEPADGRTTIEKIASPMQCEALDYRSSFSRAILITTPNRKKLYISGTASIGSDGRTEHLNDCARQIELTMQVIGALAKSGSMTWSDSVEAIAYFKDSRDFALFDEYCAKYGLDLPHIKIEADICRSELLFELELTLSAAI
ncbi:MAG: hypothetical protein LLF76_00725 [Planctomycetaceae bacterium]|nr:hypothetical protein [Planctomycetaceae bacterium]